MERPPAQTDEPLDPLDPEAHLAEEHSRPDMKIDPDGQILNDGTEVGDVGGSSMGLGGIGHTTAGGGTGPTKAGGTDPGPTGGGPVDET